MRKRIIKEISLILIISLICAVIVILLINTTSNKQVEEEIEVAKINEIIAGNESILYVDLTQKLDNYDKVLENKSENDTKESVENQFESTSIILDTSDIMAIENYGNAQSIVKVADNIYCIHYDSPKDAEEGYNILSKNEEIQVCKDEKVYLLENNEYDNINTVETLGISSSNANWGTYTTGLFYYAKKLNQNKNLDTIKVAVIDTGILPTHEAFTNEMTSDRLVLNDAYNSIDKNKDVTDNVGHGTKVAGAIAGATSNNIKILPIKAMNSNSGKLTDVMEAIRVAVTSGADILNLSFGTENIQGETLENFEKLLKEVNNSGKIIVSATGNSGVEGLQHPASSIYTIAVSAVGIYDKVSNINGLASYSNFGDGVDFAAPGSAVVLPTNTGNTSYTNPEDATSNGTSYAVPLIASALAMLKSEYPAYTPEQLKTKLKEYCYDVKPEGKDKYFGYGVLDFSGTMFSKPVIASINVANEWAKTNIINLTAICANKITQVGYSTTENTQPTEWKDITSGNFLSYGLTVNTNGKYYIWIKDEKENIVKQEVEVKFADSKVPTITNQIITTNIAKDSFKISVNAQDQDSGLARVIVYYKKIGENSYKTATHTFATSGTGETKNTTIAYTVPNLESGTEYSVYAEIYDMAGNEITTNTITVTTLENTSESENTGANNTTVSNTIANNTTTNNTVADNTTFGSNTTTSTNITNTSNTTINTNTDNTANTTNTTTNTNTNTNNTTNTTDNSAITNTKTQNTTNDTTNESTNVVNQLPENTAEENETIKNTTQPDQSEENNITAEIVKVYPLKEDTENENINSSAIKATSDNSIASKILPKTGDNKIVILVIIISTISGVFTYFKYQKIKEIK